MTGTSCTESRKWVWLFLCLLTSPLGFVDPGAAVILAGPVAERTSPRLTGGDKLVRAAGIGSPWINLRRAFVLNGESPEGSVTSLAQTALTDTHLMTSGDFNQDGFTDLAITVARGDTSWLRLHPGTDRQRHPDSILERPKTSVSEELLPVQIDALPSELAVRANLLCAGDFNGDGYDDLVYASSNEASLYVRNGSPAGLTGSDRRVPLSDLPKDLVAGEFNRRDGIADLAIVTAANPGRVLLFQSQQGGFDARPAVIEAGDNIVGARFADVDDYFPFDLVIATRSSLVILRGTGVPYPTGELIQELDTLPSRFHLLAVEVGDFVWDRLHRSDIGLVFETGAIKFLEFDLPERGVHPSELAPDRFVELWKERKTVQAALGFALPEGSGKVNVARARLSTVPLDELVFWQDTVPAVHLVFGEASKWKEKEPSSLLPPPVRMDMPLAIPLNDPGTVVIPIHLNADTQDDLAILHRDSGLVSLSISVAGATYTVNNEGTASDADTKDGICDIDTQTSFRECTLHAAIEQANANPGADSIEFSVTKVSLTEGLPRATDPIVIDGSIPGGRVELTRDGDGGGGPWISGGNSVVRNLVVNGALDPGPYLSGNAGIVLDDNGWNVVENCYLGLNPAGTQAKPNFTGLEIHDSPSNTIGGSSLSQRNIISGNAGTGVDIIGGGSRDNVIEGNLIGTDVTGQLPVGNAAIGLVMTYTETGSPTGPEPVYSERPGNNTIENNVISASVALPPLYDPSGKSGMGVHISADGTVFKTNKVGTALDGTTRLGNASFGVAVGDGTGNTIVQNIIAFNQGDGVAVAEWMNDARKDVGHATISQNSIHSNGGLGINLMNLTTPDGVTPNDALDADSGPNEYANFPVVSLNQAKTELRVTYDGLPSTEFTFEFFRNNACDASGHGEGETYLKKESWFGITYPIKGTTDSSGHMEKTISLAGIAEGVITATATDSSGNTSEFSKCPVPDSGIRLSPQLVLGLSLCGTQEREIRVTDIATGKEISGDDNIRYQWFKLDGSGLPKDLLDDGLNELRKKYLKLVEKIAQVDVRKSKTSTESKAWVKFASSGINILRAVREKSPTDVEYSNYALLIGGMELAQADSLKIEPVSLTSSVINTLSGYLTKRFGGKFPLNAPMILMPPSTQKCSWTGALGQNGFVKVKSLTFKLLGDDVDPVDIMDAFSALGWVPSAHPLAWLARVISIGAPVAVAELLNYSSAIKTKTRDDPFIDLGPSVPPYLEGSVQSKAPGISAVLAEFDMTKYCLGKANDMMLVAVAPDLEAVDIRAETGQLEDPLLVELNHDRKAETVGMFNFFSGAAKAYTIPLDKIGSAKPETIRKIVQNMIPGGHQLKPNTLNKILHPSNATPVGGIFQGGENFFELEFTYKESPLQLSFSKMRMQTGLPDMVNEWTMVPDPNTIASVQKKTGLLTGLKPGRTEVRADVCIPFSSLTRRNDTNGVVVLKGGAIYVQKYADLVADGKKDHNDPGLNGWTIQLESAKDGSIRTLTTSSVDLDEDGSINTDFEVGWAVFDNLESGIGYTAREIVKSGWTQTSPNPPMLTLASQQARLVRIGNFEDMTVEGVKYVDLNGNGSRDAGEPGSAGWTIEVDLNSDGSVEHIATTKADGSYRIEHLGLGDINGDRSFIVQEVPDPDWIQTDPLGNTPFPMFSGLQAKVDFGNFRYMTIGGKKFHDINGNGTHDSGEPGLPEWEFELDLNNDGVVDRRATSNATGNFEFLNVGPGDPLGARQLKVSEVQQNGWMQTFPATSHIHPFQSGGMLTTDFGNTQGTGICGIKFNDLNGNGLREPGEPPLAGWTIELTKPDGSKIQQATDVDGRYCFSGLDPGTYKVRELMQSDWFQTMPVGTGEYSIALKSGESKNDADFGNFQEASLCGNKFNDLNGNAAWDGGEPGLPGWTIRLSTPAGTAVTSQTATGGSYCFEKLGPGVHSIREVLQDGWSQTYPAGGSHTVSTVSGQATEGLNFGNRETGGGFVLVSVCGTKYEDLNGNGSRQTGEPGLGGWRIELLAGTEDILQTTETDSQGRYCFAQIGPGAYSIREVLSNGWIQKSPGGTGIHTIATESGKNLDNLDFGNFQLGRVSGMKFNDLNQNGAFNSGEPGLASWTIFADLNQDGVLNNPKVSGVCDSSATEPCAKTNSNGQYTIRGLDIGTYPLREVQQPGWEQTTANPPDVPIQTSGAVVSNRNFGNREFLSGDLSYLYFPYFQSGSGLFTAYAISNYSDQAANIRFVAYRQDGELHLFRENPAIVQLPAGQQLARLGPEIFGEKSSNAQLGWVEVASDNPEIGSFFQFGTSNVQGLDGGVAITELSPHFYFTRVYEYAPDLTTELAIANPNPSDIHVTLTFLGYDYPFDGSDKVEVVHQVPSKGVLFGSVSDLFGSLEGSGCIEVTVNESLGAAGFELIKQKSPTSLVGLNALYSGGSGTSYSAQLASTSGIFTNLKLLNTAIDHEQIVQLSAIGESGAVIDQVLWFLFPQEQAEDFAMYIFGVDFENPLIGSLKVEGSSGSLLGDVLFGDADQAQYLAALPLQAQPFKKAVFSHVANGLGFFTGLAFYNPGQGSATIKIRVKRANGELAGDTEVTLGPGARISRTVNQFVPASSGQVGGYILIDSSNPVIAQQLFGLNSLSLMSAVPPTVIE